MRQNTTEDKSVRSRLAHWAMLVARFVKRVWVFPSVVAATLRQKRRQTALEAAEAERLDRIRNPFRYLGK